MITLLALAALSAGFYMGWRTRGDADAARSHKRVELGSCTACRLVYVGPKRKICPACGLPLHFQQVLPKE